MPDPTIKQTKCLDVRSGPQLIVEASPSIPEPEAVQAC